MYKRQPVEDARSQFEDNAVGAVSEDIGSRVQGENYDGAVRVEGPLEALVAVQADHVDVANPYSPRAGPLVLHAFPGQLGAPRVKQRLDLCLLYTSRCV